MRLSINEKLKISRPYLKVLLSQFERCLLMFSYYYYQKDERAESGNLLTTDGVFPPPHIKVTPTTSLFFLSLSLKGKFNSLRT
jgi:hypothetical protein